MSKQAARSLYEAVDQAMTRSLHFHRWRLWYALLAQLRRPVRHWAGRSWRRYDACQRRGGHWLGALSPYKPQSGSFVQSTCSQCGYVRIMPI